MGFRIKTYFLIDFYAYHFNEHFLAREQTGAVTHVSVILVSFCHPITICFCWRLEPYAVLSLGSFLMSSI